MGKGVNGTGVFRTYNICGVAFMIRKDVFRAVGWFDEGYSFVPRTSRSRGGNAGGIMSWGGAFLWRHPVPLEDQRDGHAFSVLAFGSYPPQRHCLLFHLPAIRHCPLGIPEKSTMSRAMDTNITVWESTFPNTSDTS